jgi:uncharacterized protein (TIGR03790 family)
MSRFFPSLLILACSGDSLDRDTAPGPPTCPVLEGFVVKGDAIPGRIVEVEAQGSIEGTELRWTVSSGYAEGSGNTATWSLDPELAIYASEQATIEATASLAGCDNAHYSETLEINYPDAHRVLLITNPTVADSLSVAEHYAAFRPVPDENICAIATAAETTLDGADLSDFTMALGDCLDTVGPHIQILLPVFGVPYKVTDRIDDIAANDSVPTTSLDALLFLGRAADQASAAIYNPLYQDSSSMEGSYAPYQPLGDLLPEAEDSMGVPLFLVTRIDGVDAEAAMALVDRAEEAQALAQTGELDGTVYVDGKSGDTEPTSDDFGTYEAGEWNMWGTRQIFEDLAFYDVVWDGNEAEFGTKPAPTECPDALYYAGWYSYNHYNDAFTWAPGAIGGHLDSCSACDIRESTSWSASALQRGITATFGAVGEPYVAGMPEYDQFYLYLLQGGSYAEAAYESTVIGLWMMTWLGDPLYRPYPGGVLD